MNFNYRQLTPSDFRRLFDLYRPLQERVGVRGTGIQVNGVTSALHKLLRFTLTAMLIVLCASQTTYAKKVKEPLNNTVQYINIEWWEKYNDPILTEHLQNIYTKNHDLKIATLKVKEGEKLVKISFANELPQLSFDGALNRNLKSSNLQFGDLIIPSFKQSELQLPLTMSYEVDIWGMNRYKTKSIEKQL